MLFAYLVIGVVLLYLGAESLIKGACSLAGRLGVSLMVIGLTVMGYGTGTPELVVSVEASLAGSGDIAIGNVIGSNIANTALIIGLAAMVHPITVKRHLIISHCMVMTIVSLLFAFFLFFVGEISRAQAALLLLAFLFYTCWIIFSGKSGKEYREEIVRSVKITPYSGVTTEIILITTGFLALFGGGELFLRGAILLARRFAVSEAHIGLSVIALGTSLPELSTSLVAAWRKREDIALANVLGSNVFNILAIVGTAAAVNPIKIADINYPDYAFLAFLTLLLLAFIRYLSSIKRVHGLVLFTLYCAYMGYLFDFVA